jgi:SPP1 gp7 family putative phage head morphogenesis protein
MLIQSKLIADAELSLSTNGYVDLIGEAYNRTMFDLHQGVGVAFDFATIPKNRIEAILKRPWSGMHYSSRIWHNTDVLASLLSEVITGGFKSGASLRDMRKDVEERMQVGKHAANRLLRTETTYMANAAEMESYEEAGIDRYRFIATLDNRTSEQCRHQDNKIYAVKDARPGYNMPPLHAYCRSTTIAVISGRQESGLQRRALDPDTGKRILVPASMSYRQWHKKYVEKAA